MSRTLILLYNSSCYVHWYLIEQSRDYQKSVTVNIFIKEKLQVSKYESGDSKEDEGFVNI